MTQPFRARWVVVALGVLATACTPAPNTQVSPDRISEAETAAREAIRNEQALAGTPLTQRSVGITPLAVDVTDTTLAPLGYGLADLLLTDLARARQLTVVDRTRLEALLRELQLASSGRIDSGTAPRVGHLIQARYLVLGRVAQMPNQQLRIDARIADVPTTSTGQPLSFSAGVNDILDAEKALALQIIEQLGVTLTPAERAAIDQRPTRNIAALLAYSRAVRYETLGQFPSAAAEYQNATRLDPGFGLAAQRLNEVRTHTEPRSASASAQQRSPLATAAGVAVEHVNPALPPTIADRPGGAADPSFPSTKAIIILTVTVP